MGLHNSMASPYDLPGDAGVAGLPRPVFQSHPSIVKQNGRPEQIGTTVGMQQKDAYVGDEAQSKPALKDSIEKNVKDIIENNVFYDDESSSRSLSRFALESRGASVRNTREYRAVLMDLESGTRDDVRA